MGLRVGRAWQRGEAAGGTCRATGGRQDYRGDLRGRRPFLLRGEHERARVPARLPGRDRGDTSGRGRAGDPRPRQRLDRRLGGRGAGARGRRRADRAGAADREGRERLAADGTGEGALLPAAERGLRTPPRRDRGPARGARRRPERRRGDAAAARRRTAPPTPAPGASPGSARRSPGRSSCTAGRPCRAPASRPAGSTGRSRARCWSAARRPRRSASWIPTSSSTTTSATSPSGSPRRAGTSSSSPPRPPSTTTSSPATSPPGCRGSSNSTATATSTCASTTGGWRRWRSAVLTAWSYAARALAAGVIPGQPAEIYRAHARQALFPARGAGIRDRAESGLVGFRLGLRRLLGLARDSGDARFELAHAPTEATPRLRQPFRAEDEDGDDRTMAISRGPIEENIEYSMDHAARAE